MCIYNTYMYIIYWQMTVEMISKSLTMMSPTISDNWSFPL